MPVGTSSGIIFVLGAIQTQVSYPQEPILLYKGEQNRLMQRSRERQIQDAGRAVVRIGRPAELPNISRDRREERSREFQAARELLSSTCRSGAAGRGACGTPLAAGHGNHVEERLTSLLHGTRALSPDWTQGSHLLRRQKKPSPASLCLDSPHSTRNMHFKAGNIPFSYASYINYSNGRTFSEWSFDFKSKLTIEISIKGIRCRTINFFSIFGTNVIVFWLLTSQSYATLAILTT